MKDSEKRLTLTSFDDIFKNDETRREESAERVQLISVDLMDDFPNHPFKILAKAYENLTKEILEIERQRKKANIDIIR